MTRSAITPLVLIAAGWALSATSLMGSSLQDLQMMGSGTVVTNCPGMLAPNCTIRTEGTATATVNGAPLLEGRFEVRFDTGSAPTLNGWPSGITGGTQQGICIPGSYLGFLVAANGDVLRFTNVGTVCEEASPGSPYHFNGTFRITGGTGQFTTATGLGNIVVTATPGDSQVLVKMSGAINY